VKWREDGAGGQHVRAVGYAKKKNAMRGKLEAKRGGVRRKELITRSPYRVTDRGRDRDDIRH
jgi:hypothetical protein